MSFVKFVLYCDRFSWGGEPVLLYEQEFVFASSPPSALSGVRARHNNNLRTPATLSGVRARQNVQSRSREAGWYQRHCFVARPGPGLRSCASRLPTRDFSRLLRSRLTPSNKSAAASGGRLSLVPAGNPASHHRNVPDTASSPTTSAWYLHGRSASKSGGGLASRKAWPPSATLEGGAQRQIDGRKETRFRTAGELDLGGME